MSRAVVVKVVSRKHATHEARVLEAVGATKQARAIQVLAQIRVNDGDVGLMTRTVLASCSRGLRRCQMWCDRRFNCARYDGAAVLSGLWYCAR